MARIAGIDIPREKRVEIALTYVYGIGLTRSKLILANTGVNPDTRVKDLSDSDVQKLRGATEEFTLEGDLRRKEGMALKRLQDIGCVRGRRHRMSLPVRGQRTRTNARTPSCSCISSSSLTPYWKTHSMSSSSYTPYIL